MTAKGPIKSTGTKPGLLSFSGNQFVPSIDGPLSPLLIDPIVFSSGARLPDEQIIFPFDGLFGVPDAKDFFGREEGPKTIDDASTRNDAARAGFFGLFDDSPTDSAAKESLFLIGALVLVGIIAFNVKRFKK